MTKNFILEILFFVIILFLSSCGIYHPMTTDIPLISEKNDLKIDAGVSLIPSANATISYGLTDDIAVQGFGSVGTDNKYYIQAATGWFNNNGNNRVVEIYGGFGYGYGNAYSNANPGNLYGNYQLYFAQANYGKISSNTSNFETGFGLKAGYLHSSLTDQNYYDWISETGTFTTYNDNSLLLEPVGFIRFGGNKLKVNFKLGTIFIYKFTNMDKSLPYNYLNLGISLQYSL